MQTGKKKIKSKKPKLAAGAVLSAIGGIQSGGNTPQRDPNTAFMYRNEDKGVATVSSLPIIGGLTGAAMKGSAAIRGEGTNAGANIGAGIIDPTSGGRAIKDAGGSNAQALFGTVNPIYGGIMSAKLKKAQLAKYNMEQEQKVDAKLITNAGQQQFATGGQLVANRLGKAKGGDLQPISDDAVEVQANNPNQTDSVELNNAFVDNNEIIDKKNRVFSDEVKLPSGKTIAKEAKRLEKMKSKKDQTRFHDSDSHIDRKLDELFNYQEEVKHTQTSDHLAKGGSIHIKPENKGKFTAYKKRTGKTTEEALHSSDPHVRKMANFAKNAKKWHHEDGGTIDPQNDPSRNWYGDDSMYINDAGNLEKRKKKATPAQEFNKTQGFEKTFEQFKSKPKKAFGGKVDPTTVPAKRTAASIYQEKVRDSSIKPLVNIDESDPIFYDKNKFQGYYRDKAIKALSPEDQQTHANLRQQDPLNADAFIASRGGTPDFTTYISSVRESEKHAPQTNLKALMKTSNGLASNKAEGYRYDQGLPDKESITNNGMALGGVYTKKPKYAKGGEPKSYNPTQATTDLTFQDWYKKNTLEGKNNTPYSDKLDYDYYSFYKDKGKGNITDHFPDTYKRPNHETFSNESIYSTPENPGGSWVGDKFKKQGKFKYSKGGPFSEKDLLDTGSTAGSTPITLQNQTSTTPPQTTRNGSKIDWNAVGNGVATAAPNVANAFLQRRLQGPLAPQLETQAQLKRFNPDYQLAEAGRQYNGAQALVARNTPQSADLVSATGSLLSRRLSANNEIQGQANQLNANIANQEAVINQGVQGRNADRTTEYRNEGVAFKNKKTQLTSENIANLSAKIQSNSKERNQRNRDQQAYGFLESAYGDSGVLSRLKEERPDLFENLGKRKKKMGGKIPSKLYSKAC